MPVMMRTGRTTRALSGLKLSPKVIRLDDGRLGVRVMRVRPGSPAARGGLQPGDILLRANGVRTRRPADLRLAVRRETKLPFTLKLRLQRDGKEQVARLRITMPREVMPVRRIRKGDAV